MKIESLFREKQVLKNQIEQNSTRFEALEGIIENDKSDGKNELMNLNSKIQTLSKEIKEKSQISLKLEEDIERKGEEYREKMTEFETKMVVMKNDILDKDREIEELTSSNENSSLEIKLLGTEIEKLVSEHSHLESNGDTSKTKIRSLEESLRIANETSDKYLKEIEDLKVKESEVQSQNMKNISKINEVENRYIFININKIKSTFLAFFLSILY